MTWLLRLAHPLPGLYLNHETGIRPPRGRTAAGTSMMTHRLNCSARTRRSSARSRPESRTSPTHDIEGKLQRVLVGQGHIARSSGSSPRLTSSPTSLLSVHRRLRWRRWGCSRRRPPPQWTSPPPSRACHGCSPATASPTLAEEHLLLLARRPHMLAAPSSPWAQRRFSPATASSALAERPHPQSRGFRLVSARLYLSAVAPLDTSILHHYFIS
jgi:hypothetical protein